MNWTDGTEIILWIMVILCYMVFLNSVELVLPSMLQGTLLLEQLLHSGHASNLISGALRSSGTVTYSGVSGDGAVRSPSCDLWNCALITTMQIDFHFINKEQHFPVTVWFIFNKEVYDACPAHGNGLI